MIEELNSIFENEGFSRTKFGLGSLYIPLNKMRQHYWLVVKPDSIDDFLKKQPDLFEEASIIYSDPSFAKNLSVLVLWETTGEVNTSNLKNSTMRIEEDPFHFKKHVLSYSSKEKEALFKELKDQSLNDFLKTKISSEDFFKKYKESPDGGKSLFDLAFRIAIKLPFLTITLEDNTDLDSLEQKKNSKIDIKDDSSDLFSLEKMVLSSSVDVCSLDSFDLLEKLESSLLGDDK